MVSLLVTVPCGLWFLAYLTPLLYLETLWNIPAINVAPASKMGLPFASGATLPKFESPE